MKIAVTATGASLESSVDPRFGRCEYLLVVETEDLTFEAVVNPHGSRDSAAGIQTAQMVAETGAKIVLTGNCGPNAYQTLSAAGLTVVVGCSGTVREAVENFKAGRYSHAEQPNVAGHFGASSPASADASTFASPRMGRGMGSGMGMGMGMGRGQRGGMGRGMGRGGGGAQMGRGRGRGPGARQADAPASAPSPFQSQPAPQPQSAATHELDLLKAQAEAVEQQLAALNERIGHIAAPAPTGRLVAVVDANLCAACGLCMRVCPAEAISVNGVAKIDAGRCTACGQCVAECPQEAISLRKAQRT